MAATDWLSLCRSPAHADCVESATARQWLPSSKKPPSASDRTALSTLLENSSSSDTLIQSSDVASAYAVPSAKRTVTADWVRVPFTLLKLTRSRFGPRLGSSSSTDVIFVAVSDTTTDKLAVSV